jgi:hypothetical protein
VRFADERVAELVERCVERVDSARIECAERRFASDELNRRALLRTRLREKQRAGVEFKPRQHDFRTEAERAAAIPPSEPPRDHQMNDQKQ